MTIVRDERPEDVNTVRDVNLAAFGGAAEADLVDLLRGRRKLLVSLVAESDGVVVGHIAFSRVVVESGLHLRSIGLGPMAVVPSLQRRGVGSMLVRAGLDACLALSCDFVVVLGHPNYYPRFGFVPAGPLGLRCAWDVPDDVFMVRELREGALLSAMGLVTYEPEFNIAT